MRGRLQSAARSLPEHSSMGGCGECDASHAGHRPSPATLRAGALLEPACNPASGEYRRARPLANPKSHPVSRRPPAAPG